MTISVQIPFQLIIHNNPTTVCYTTFANEKVFLSNVIIKKVKRSRNMPGVAQRVPGGLGSQISMTFGT